MGSVRPIRKGGALVGYMCDYDHNHGSQAEAANCDPKEFAENKKRANKEQEQNRRLAIMDHKDFDKAVFAAKQLGASDDDAEEVVLVNGTDKVIAARDMVAGLGIPKAKKSTQPQTQSQKGTDDKDKTAGDKTGDGKPPDPNVTK